MLQIFLILLLVLFILVQIEIRGEVKSDRHILTGLEIVICFERIL
jgi:hypothetical protein